MNYRWYFLTAMIACGVGVLHSNALTQKIDSQIESSGQVKPIGGAFNLVDHIGQARNESDFHGKFVLMYFGYTFCPDVCPTALMQMSASLDKFEKLNPEAAQNIQPIFISLDPDRDTQSTLSQYVSFFHPNLIGLTGTEHQIQDVAEKYHIYYNRHEANSNNGYLIDHSSVIYLMSPSGEYLRHFTHDTLVQEMVDALANEIAMPKDTKA